MDEKVLEKAAFQMFDNFYTIYHATPYNEDELKLSLWDHKNYKKQLPFYRDKTVETKAYYTLDEQKKITWNNNLENFTPKFDQNQQSSRHVINIIIDEFFEALEQKNQTYDHDDTKGNDDRMKQLAYEWTVEKLKTFSKKTRKNVKLKSLDLVDGVNVKQTHAKHVRDYNTWLKDIKKNNETVNDRVIQLHLNEMIYVIILGLPKNRTSKFSQKYVKSIMQRSGSKENKDNQGIRTRLSLIANSRVFKANNYVAQYITENEKYIKYRKGAEVEYSTIVNFVNDKLKKYQSLYEIYKTKTLDEWRSYLESNLDLERYLMKASMMFYILVGCRKMEIFGIGGVDDEEKKKSGEKEHKKQREDEKYSSHKKNAGSKRKRQSVETSTAKKKVRVDNNKNETVSFFSLLSIIDYLKRDTSLSPTDKQKLELFRKIFNDINDGLLSKNQQMIIQYGASKVKDNGKPITVSLENSPKWLIILRYIYTMLSRIYGKFAEFQKYGPKHIYALNDAEIESIQKSKNGIERIIVKPLSMSIMVGDDQDKKARMKSGIEIILSIANVLQNTYSNHQDQINYLKRTETMIKLLDWVPKKIKFHFFRNLYVELTSHKVNSYSTLIMPHLRQIILGHTGDKTQIEYHKARIIFSGITHLLSADTLEKLTKGGQKLEDLNKELSYDNMIDNFIKRTMSIFDSLDQRLGGNDDCNAVTTEEHFRTLRRAGDFGTSEKFFKAVIARCIFKHNANNTVTWFNTKLTRHRNISRDAENQKNVIKTAIAEFSNILSDVQINGKTVPNTAVMPTISVVRSLGYGSTYASEISFLTFLRNAQTLYKSPYKKQFLKWYRLYKKQIQIHQLCEQNQQQSVLNTLCDTPLKKKIRKFITVDKNNEIEQEIYAQLREIATMINPLN